jgi:hypothetical protein
VGIAMTDFVCEQSQSPKERLQLSQISHCGICTINQEKQYVGGHCRFSILVSTIISMCRRSLATFIHMKEGFPAPSTSHLGYLQWHIIAMLHYPATFSKLGEWYPRTIAWNYDSLAQRFITFDRYAR